MLEEYLRSYFQQTKLKKIFQDVVGTIDPKKIQSLTNTFINQYLCTGIAEILFVHASNGVVFGFKLENEQHVILKIFSKKLNNIFLGQINHIQEIFYQEGFPAPKVLSPIFPFGKTLAGIYELIPGEKANPHAPNIRTELAKNLAQFTQLVEKYHLPPLDNYFHRTLGNKLWPIPHNVLFNLKETTRGAGWIAKKAMAARKVIKEYSLPTILAHTDWGVKNAIFARQKLVGIIDWDSLGAMSEAEMVGRAAAQFTADWGVNFKATPSPEEGRSFIQIYQDFRGKKFNTAEYKVASAAADALIAIIARLEHCGGFPSSAYEDLLLECGEESFLYC